MEQKPIIYLNHRVGKQSDFCVLYFKRNEALIQRIRQNSWITWYAEFKAFVAPSNANTIGLLIDIFEDIADINTNYYHATLKEDTETIAIGDTQYFTGILKKKDKGGTITLVPIENEEGRFITIHYKKQKPVHQLLKECKYLQWSKHLRCFVLPARRSYLINLLEALTPKLRIRLHNKLVIKDYRTLQLLFEQAYDKDRYFKSCPIDFIKHMQLKAYSFNTINSYYYYVLRFLNCYKYNSINQINTFDSDKINEYHQLMIGEKTYSEQTINQSVNAIKLYYNGYLERTVQLNEVVRPKVGKTLPKVWSKEEIARLLSSISNLKHKTLISLIYGSGLRIGEALRLRIEDIDSKRMRLRILGAKGKKDRYSIIGNFNLTLLREYYKAYKPKEYLFEGFMGGQYSPTSAGRILNAAIERSGVPKRGGLHSLRHSFATHLLESGTDLRYIQELLGHKSSVTTEIYTYVSNKYIQQIKSPIDELFD